MSKLKVNGNATFFHSRAEELRQLQKVLEKQFAGKNTVLAPLQEAAKLLDEQADGTKTMDVWGYSIKDLIIPVGYIHNIEPSGLQAKICLNCECECNVKDWDNDCDPFISYSFRLRVYGDNQGIKYSWGMHIDKDNKNSKDEWHPLYHLHCFESRLDSPTVLTDTVQHKGSMHMNVPRLVHYPLDIVLGIGFCLMNFYKKDVFKKLYANDFQFPRLYRKSYDRILKPYLESLAGKPGCVFDKKELCPQIV